MAFIWEVLQQIVSTGEGGRTSRFSSGMHGEFLVVPATLLWSLARWQLASDAGRAQNTYVPLQVAYTA